MKTGFYVPIEKDGKWENSDLANITNEDFRQLLQSGTSIDAQNWALALHQWIINNVVFETEII